VLSVTTGAVCYNRCCLLQQVLSVTTGVCCDAAAVSQWQLLQLSVSGGSCQSVAAAAAVGQWRQLLYVSARYSGRQTRRKWREERKLRLTRWRERKLRSIRWSEIKLRLTRWRERKLRLTPVCAPTLYISHRQRP
jgi:hypothetical protein